MHGIKRSYAHRKRREVPHRMHQYINGKEAHMKARLSSGNRAGSAVVSGRMARSKVSVSGPCGVMHMCRLAPVWRIRTIRMDHALHIWMLQLRPMNATRADTRQSAPSNAACACARC